jgi:hypothetical protein
LVACALLSKETAVSCVLLLPATDWVFFKMRRGALLPVGYAALGIVVASYLLVRMPFTSVDSGFFATPGKYFIQKFVGMPYGFFVQPWNVAVARIPAGLRCCATVITLALLFWAVVRGTGAKALAGPALILITTLPVYSYFYVSPDLRATRYLYFPAIGWALLTSQVLTSVISHRRAFGATLACIIFLSSASLQFNLRPWRTAGEIVRGIAVDIRGGRVANAAALRTKYGEGLEFSDGIPSVYQGVYLFVNGYSELRSMLANPDGRQ